MPENTNDFIPSTEIKPRNAWEQSQILQHLRTRMEQNEPLRIAFLDIDLTMTGDVEAQKQAREALEARGFSVVYVTARTEEMVLSEMSYKASDPNELRRPHPKLKRTDEGMKEAYIDQFPTAVGIFDPDIVSGATGSSLLLRQSDGTYRTDEAFVQQFKAMRQGWRNDVEACIKTIDPHGDFIHLAPIENLRNYDQGLVDIAPPDFRVQINITNRGGTMEEGMAHKQRFSREVKALRDSPDTDPRIKAILQNIRLTDDSNPDKHRFSLYATPKRAWKGRVVEHIVENIQNQLKIPRQELHVLLAGDSHPDIGMGLESALGTDATFLLVGGARVTNAIKGETDAFAGEMYGAIQRRMTKHENGRYTFSVPLVHQQRTVIIGNEAFPGTSGPQTILAYLRQQIPNGPLKDA